MSDAVDTNVITAMLVEPLGPWAVMQQTVILRFQARLSPTKRVQIYMDGQLAAVTCDADQREVMLHVAGDRPHWIEAVVVDAALAWQPVEERGYDPEPVWQWIGMLAKDANWPIDAQAVLWIDAEQAQRWAVWDGHDSAGGFGAWFGEQFGHDAATQPGFGQGDMGLASHGFDGRALKRIIDTLAPGTHAIQITIESADGQTLATSPTVNHTVDTTEPPRTLQLENPWMLTW